MEGKGKVNGKVWEVGMGRRENGCYVRGVEGMVGVWERGMGWGV